MKSSYVVGDACSKRYESGDVSEEDPTSPWYSLQPAVSQNQVHALVKRATAGEDLSLFTEGGDFCSLNCIVNWASALLALQDLDEDALPE